MVKLFIILGLVGLLAAAPATQHHNRPHDHHHDDHAHDHHHDHHDHHHDHDHHHEQKELEVQQDHEVEHDHGVHHDHGDHPEVHPTKKPVFVDIVESDNEKHEDGSYHFSYRGEDGTFREETAVWVNPGTEEAYLDVTGSYSFIDKDGQEVVVNYKANKDGFVPEGNNIPDEISVAAKLAASLPKPVDDHKVGVDHHVDDHHVDDHHVVDEHVDEVRH